MAASDAKPVPVKNVAFRIYFPMMLNTGKVNTEGASTAATIVKDGGSSSFTTNTVTQHANGWYSLDLTATEMDADCVKLTITSTTENACDEVLSLYPQESGDIKVDVQTVSGTTQTAGDLKSLIDTVDGVVDAIKAKTDNLPASPASTTNITAGTITTVTNLTNLPTMPTDWITAAGMSAGAVTEIQSGLSTLTEAGVRTAVGLSANDLDAQLDAILVATNTGIDAVGGVTNYLSTHLGPAGENLTALMTYGDANWATATGFSTLDGDGVRSAIGLTNPDLDGQLSSILSATNAAIADIASSQSAIIASIPVPPSTSAITTAVWAAGTKTLTALPTMPADWITATGLSAGAVTEIQSGLALAATALSTAVWTPTKAGYLDAAISSVSTGGVSAGDIALAVWSEPTRELTASPLSTEAIAAGVWDLSILDHQNADSFGQLLALVNAGIAALPSAATITTAVWANAARTITGGTIGAITGLTLANVENMATRFLGMIELDSTVYRFTANTLETGPAGGEGGGGLTSEQEEMLEAIHQWHLGKKTRSGTTITLYAADNITVLKTLSYVVTNGRVVSQTPV